MCVLPTTAARCTSWSPRVESTAATSAPSSRSTSMRSSRLRMHAICSSENPCRSRQSTDRLPCATSSFSTSSEELSTIAPMTASQFFCTSSLRSTPRRASWTSSGACAQAYARARASAAITASASGAPWARSAALLSALRICSASTRCSTVAADTARPSAHAAPASSADPAGASSMLAGHHCTCDRFLGALSPPAAGAQREERLQKCRKYHKCTTPKETPSQPGAPLELQAMAAAAAAPGSPRKTTKAPARRALPTKEPEHPPYEPPAPHLDLCSSEFDPAAALAAESLALPYPKIKPLDNLAACRYRLLAKDEREQHRTQRQAKEAAAKLKTESKVIKEAHPFFHKQEEIAAAVREERFKRKKKVRTILDRMTEEGQGPLDVVGRAFRDKLRVRVDVRRSNGQIAQCLGYIIAFDKHMNMVLMDVTEQYRTLTWHPRHEVRTDKDFHIHNPEVFRTLSRKAKKRARAHANKLVAVKASHERHLQQVLVRGDCVVLVTFNTA
eukprot:m.215973 g.215973  ORF g.215973 m.215973 type:complete len:502 (-) comp10780_c0_seq10:159-1664(-)